jgi:hypothetical protein
MPELIEIVCVYMYVYNMYVYNMYVYNMYVYNMYVCMYVFFNMIYYACSTALCSTTCRTDFLLHSFTSVVLYILFNVPWDLIC